MLALLLGFTLSLSLQRFDNRSVAVVEEANAIGTAYLRSKFLPPSLRQEAQRLFKNYVDLRIEIGALMNPVAVPCSVKPAINRAPSGQ